MNCQTCGLENSQSAKFCRECGSEFSFVSQTIRCGNCNYEGPGEPARRIISQVFAWLAIIVSPLITIIYYVATSKYRCPKCKSTFLGVRGKDGNFKKGQSANQKLLLILLTVIVGIIVIGILSSIVLASLNSAREKSRDARRISDIKQIQVALELYYANEGLYPSSISVGILDPDYIDTLPTDPVDHSKYFYEQLGGGAEYHIGANLEDSTHVVFASDLDLKSKHINGDDIAGCGGEVGRYCFDENSMY